MSLGIGQLILILIILMILFGAGRLPSIMQDLAKSLKVFRKALNDDERKE